MSAHVKIRANRSRRMRWSMLPLVIAIAAVATANLGLSLVGSSHAVTDNVTVTANVASASAVVDNCAPTAGALTITATGSAAGGSAITLGSFNYGQCAVTFGATNNAALPLQVNDNAGAGSFWALNPSGFSETTTAVNTCNVALTAGQAGFKVATGGSASINLCTAGADAASVNMRYSKFPDTATTACTSTAAVTTQTCNVAVGLLAPASATAGANSGQVNLTA